MSVLDIQGFDWIPTTSVQATLKAYLTAAGWYQSHSFGGNGDPVTTWPSATATGRFGFGTALYFGASTVSTLGPYFFGMVKPMPTSASFSILSCSMKRASTAITLSQPGGACVGFYDSNTGCPSLAVTLSPIGTLRTWTANQTTLAVSQLVASDPGVFFEDVWFNLQVKLNQGTGAIEIRVNNKTVISIPSGSINTWNSICVGSIQGDGLASYHHDFYIDDLYVLDSDGGVHNNFLGNLRVKTQVAIADGSHIDSSIGGTSPAATHWQSVNVLRTDDSKYVYTPTNANYDLYDLDPNQTGPYARAVQVRIVARQDDATQRTIKAKLKTATSLNTGATQFYLNQNYNHWTQIWNVNPDTSTDFTTSEVNGLEIGFEVIS